MQLGGTDYENHELGPGEHFGERVLIDELTRPGNFVGKTEGLALTIEKRNFDETLGDFSKLIAKSADKKRLVRIHTMCFFSVMSGSM